MSRLHKAHNWRMVSVAGNRYTCPMEIEDCVDLRCPYCLELGLATYSRHPSPKLTGLYGRFHSESGRAPVTLVVCNECDTIQELRAA